MDPLLCGLEANHLGPSISDVYVGALAHADDIRTITSNVSTLQQQVEYVQQFADDNALTLNLSKCEVLIASSTKPALSIPICSLGAQMWSTLLRIIRVARATDDLPACFTLEQNSG
jgi:hypothetical protein